jgi:hypothetical protein
VQLLRFVIVIAQSHDLISIGWELWAAAIRLESICPLNS